MEQNGGKKSCCVSFVSRMHLNSHKLTWNTVDKVLKQTLIINLSVPLATGPWCAVHFPDLCSPRFCFFSLQSTST